MISKTLIARMLGLALLVSAPLAVADKLADIRQNGKLICGTLGVYPPNSFQDPKTRELVGYDIDVCRKIAEHLKVGIEFKLISVAARVPELEQGRIDVLAGNFTYTPERAKQVDFSHTYFTAGEKIAVHRESGITDFAGLTGKKISSVEGSTSAAAAAKAIPQAELVTFKDGPSAFLAFTQGKSAAYATNELILSKYAREVAQSTPIDILPEATLVSPFGIGIKQDEPALRDAVNDALLELEQSGELDRIFDKWVGKDSEYGLKRDFKVGPISLAPAGPAAVPA